MKLDVINGVIIKNFGSAILKKYGRINWILLHILTSLND